MLATACGRSGVELALAAWRQAADGFCSRCCSATDGATGRRACTGGRRPPSDIPVTRRRHPGVAASLRLRSSKSLGRGGSEVARPWRLPDVAKRYSGPDPAKARNVARLSRNPFRCERRS